jgi:hypothetical protein
MKHKNKIHNKFHLTKLINEIKLEQKKQLNKVMSYAFLDEFAINNILNSDVLTETQSLVVRYYLKYKGIKTINENTIRSIDKKILSEGLLTEGFTDFIKKSWDAAADKVTDVGAKVKDAFVKGWEGVKTIWANFSDMIKELVDKIKSAFNKMLNFIKTKIEEVGTKLIDKMDAAWIKVFKEKHPHKHEDAKKDFDDAKSIHSHLTTYFSQKLVAGGLFEKQVMSGEFTPKDTKGISSDEVEKSMEDIAEAYKSIFSNKQYIKELLNLNEADITNVLIKNPMGRKVADYAILGIKAIFHPLATLIEVVSEQAAEKLLPVASKISSKLNGPGPFAFPILSYIVAETYQIWAYGIKGTFSFETVFDIVKPFLVPFGDALSVVIQIAHAIVLAWAIVAVIQHIRSFFDQNFGGEQVSDGYIPNGKFKIENGNLVFRNE